MIPALILLLSSLTHFFRFGNPRAVVFDEVYYGQFVADYWHGSYFFDLHPPFVKILFAFFGNLFGMSAIDMDWTHIGNSLPAIVTDLRFVTAAAGMLLPLVIYYICRKIGISKWAAFAASSLLCLENSLIVQSRCILPDAIMLIAGFSAILLYQIYVERVSKPDLARIKAPRIRASWILAASAALAGCAFSTKWTGLTFLFIIILSEGYRRYRELSESFIKSLLKTARFAASFMAISLAVYISVFAIHFSILNHSGPGDAFMSDEFNKTLVGSSVSNDKSVAPYGFIRKFAELNHAMFTGSEYLTATHPYSSKWYTWPIMTRPIFYWQSDEPNSGTPRAYLYLLGNPFIYWFGALSMIAMLVGGAYVICRNIINKKKHAKAHAAHADVAEHAAREKAFLFVVVGYLANWLPFILIGRVMFLYHYEAALVFSIIGIAYLIDSFKKRERPALIIAVIVIAAAAFIYWSPLTYGTPLADDQLNARMWLSTWR